MKDADEFLRICAEVGTQSGNFLLPRVRSAVFGIPEASMRFASWIGGKPSPSPFAWPELHGELAVFIGQLDCAEIHAAAQLDPIPRTGILQFFVTGTGAIWDEPSWENGRVRWVPNAPPDSASAGESLALIEKPTLHPCQPPTEEIPQEILDGSTYFQLRQQLDGDRRGWVVQIAGFADPVQEVMDAELEQFGGLEANRWMLLSCFNASAKDFAPYYGRYYFWIPMGDLMERQFSRVLMLFQS